MLSYLQSSSANHTNLLNSPFLQFPGHRLTVSRLLGRPPQKHTLIQFLVGSLVILAFIVYSSLLGGCQNEPLSSAYHTYVFHFQGVFLVQCTKIFPIPPTKQFLRYKSHVIPMFTPAINILFSLLHTNA